MRTLYLLRHAKSSWSDSSLDDFDRPLNARGKATRDILADWFRTHEIRPDLVICSPAKRTRQTLKPIRKIWEPRPEIVYEPKVYEASVSALKGVLRTAAPKAHSILLVGHNPGLQMLALDLIDGSTDEANRALQGKFPTGAIVRLSAESDDWQHMRGETFKLRDFILPRGLIAA